MNPDDRRRLIRTGALTAGAVAVLAWSIGVPVVRSLFLGMVAVAVVPVLSAPVEPPVTLPWVPVRRGHGARRDVSRLAWGMTRRRVDPRVVRRLSESAATRLARLRIDVGDPATRRAAEDALGPWAYSVLVVGDPHSVRQRELARLVEAVERLVEQEPHARAWA